MAILWANWLIKFVIYVAPCEPKMQQNGSLASQNFWWLAKWLAEKLPALAQNGYGYGYGHGPFMCEESICWYIFLELFININNIQYRFSFLFVIFMLKVLYYDAPHGISNTQHCEETTDGRFHPSNANESVIQMNHLQYQTRTWQWC